MALATSFVFGFIVGVCVMALGVKHWVLFTEQRLVALEEAVFEDDESPDPGAA